MYKVNPIYKSQNKPMSVAVLISGTGTNLLALYEEQKKLESMGEKNYGRIEVVFTNVPGCKGATTARELGIPVVSLNSKLYFDIIKKPPDDNTAREFYDAAAIALIEEICIPDLVVLAGYRRRFGTLFLHRYRNRVLNIYPGDITKSYLIRGVEAAIQALRAGESTIKCTVFLQKENERFGPALVQSRPIVISGLKEEDIEKIREKVRKEGEWKILPFAVHHLIAKGRIGVDQDGNLYLDGNRIPREGIQLAEADSN